MPRQRPPLRWLLIGALALALAACGGDGGGSDSGGGGSGGGGSGGGGSGGGGSGGGGSGGGGAPEAPQCTPMVRQLDALAFSNAASASVEADALNQPVQTRALPQDASQRVQPRVIALPALTGVKAAPLSAPAPGQPQQIGVARAVPQAADAAATAELLTWTKDGNGGQRAAIGVQSPGAQGMRLGLLVDQLPPRARLRVYAPGAARADEITGARALAAIQRNLDAGATGADAHTYWLPTVPGDEAVLEIALPAGADPAQVRVSLPLISHLKALPTDDQALTRAASACNVDVMCTTGNEETMHAVARMVFIENGEGYTCTGTLLNNTRQDYTPYFLSANHCISTQTVASTLETYWNYRSASCGSAQVDGSYQVIDGGAQLLYASGNTDTSFMRLNATPPSNAVFAGWDASVPASLGESVFDIHHPQSDLQKYSQGAIDSFAACTAPDANGSTSCSDSDAAKGAFYSVIWSLGVTQGGSSGSALFTSSGRQVVGQLFAGSSSCTSPKGSDVFGRLDMAFDAALSGWLSPNDSGKPICTP